MQVPGLLVSKSSMKRIGSKKERVKWEKEYYEVRDFLCLIFVGSTTKHKQEGLVQNSILPKRESCT